VRSVAHPPGEPTPAGRRRAGSAPAGRGRGRSPAARAVRYSLVAVLVLVGAWAALPATGAGNRPIAAGSPSTGALWGMTTDYVDGIAGREAQLGRTLGVHNMFFSWTDRFPGSGQTDDVAAGRMPMVTWEPWNTTLADIANGTYDTTIVSRAQAMRDFGHPIFLRFAHEMNGTWYPWSGSANGGSASGTAAYVAAWRHVHDLFAAQGATNVIWVWCANQNDSPSAAWNHWTNYYPGDNYVDWVSVDAYNWGTINGGWRSFGSMIGASAYRDYAATKPVMIAETGSNETGGSKAGWIYDLGTVLQRDYPAVEAVLWFDRSGTSYNWPIDSSGASMRAYRNVGKDTYFGGPGIPDVVVTNVSWTPAAPGAGTPILFSATLKNQGTASTPDGIVVGVGFFVDGVQTNWYGTVRDGTLAPGQSRTITSSGGPDPYATIGPGSPVSGVLNPTRYWTATSGTHAVRAVVDDVNRFDESNEYNNSLTVSLTVP